MFKTKVGIGLKPGPHWRLVAEFSDSRRFQWQSPDSALLSEPTNVLSPVHTGDYSTGDCSRRIRRLQSPVWTGLKTFVGSDNNADGWAGSFAIFCIVEVVIVKVVRSTAVLTQCSTDEARGSTVHFLWMLMLILMLIIVCLFSYTRVVILHLPLTFVNRHLTNQPHIFTTISNEHSKFVI